MKLYPLLFCLVALLMGSCKKEESGVSFEEAIASIQGRYECVSMEYQGKAIDLNNDGVCSTDLKKEFDSFSNARNTLKRFAYIYPVEEFETESDFDLSIPTQEIKYDRILDKYSLLNGSGGGNMYVSFSYGVQKDGALSFWARNDLLEINDLWNGDDEFIHMDVYHTRADRVVSFKDGILVVRIIGAYYDFSSGRFVTGPVELVYNKTSNTVR